MNPTVEEMRKKAQAVLKNAHNPYSNFYVGCCLRGKNGKLYCGCNIENISYSLTICAEGAALSALASDGERNIEEIVVVADCDKIISPCGACRQRLSEFSQPNTPVHMFNRQGDQKTMTMAELLPYSFDEKHMEEVL